MTSSRFDSPVLEVRAYDLCPHYRALKDGGASQLHIFTTTQITCYVLKQIPDPKETLGEALVRSVASNEGVLIISHLSINRPLGTHLSHPPSEHRPHLSAHPIPAQLELSFHFSAP